MKPIPATTCAEAWLKAAVHLHSTPEWRDYNLILEISNPMDLTTADREVYALVDDFLAKRANAPLSTVINTIFPASLFRRYGAAAVYDRYPKMWATIKKHPDVGWGTYFHRMTSREHPDKAEFRPLETLIQKLKGQVSVTAPKGACYELGLCDYDGEVNVDVPLYDPSTDAKQIMSGPCLSHLSFKLKKGNRLMLTAFYRSHYYVQRALGNLLGLAWLQHFVAQEVKIEAAELVCISSMGQLDTMRSKGEIKGWKESDTSDLLSNCEVAAKFEASPRPPARRAAFN